MPKINPELIMEKIKNVKDDVDELEEVVKKEYTPMVTTNAIDVRVKKFEGYWEWGIKIVLGALIVSILAIIGLK